MQQALEDVFAATGEVFYEISHNLVQQETLVLPDGRTQRGFVHRKLGDAELGNAYYRQAIAQNPDNLLARSYMGQGFVASGDLVAAKAQLTEIRTRGGRNTWAELALRMAIETGQGSTY